MDTCKMENTIEVRLTPVIITFTVTVVALVLAGYFALQRRLFLAAISIGCFLVLFNPTAAMSGELCKPIRYVDGDTFNFNRGDVLVRVRLSGFDAPELGQPFSQQATEHLRMLTEGGALCDCYKEDRHGRSVCDVRTRSGAPIAPLMLGAGYGCIDPRFEGEAKKMDRAQARAALESAQARRVGMWSQPNPQCAADFRKEGRNAK
jgi:endonuclease YncB( thermonuclease family)